MQRFTGDYTGTCPHCDEYIEFAVGIQTDREPMAMHFGPGGPQPVELKDVQLLLMVEDRAELTLRFACPMCGESADGRVTCRAITGRSG